MYEHSFITKSIGIGLNICNTVQLNLNLTHACRRTHMLARLTCVKLKTLVCASTVARDFGMHT